MRGRGAWRKEGGKVRGEEEGHLKRNLGHFRFVKWVKSTISYGWADIDNRDRSENVPIHGPGHATSRADIEKYAALQGMILKNMPPCRAAYWHLCNIGPTIMILLILHPRPWDTGKVAAPGPY